jgi:hypothetical protein
MPPQFQKAAKRKLSKGKKLVEGSAAEEATESAPFEKKEDAGKK